MLVVQKMTPHVCWMCEEATLANKFATAVSYCRLNCVHVCQRQRQKYSKQSKTNARPLYGVLLLAVCGRGAQVKCYHSSQLPGCQAALPAPLQNRRGQVFQKIMA